MGENNRILTEPDCSEVSEQPPRIPTGGGECKELLYYL